MPFRAMIYNQPGFGASGLVQHFLNFRFTHDIQPFSDFPQRQIVVLEPADEHQPVEM